MLNRHGFDEIIKAVNSEVKEECLAKKVGIYCCHRISGVRIENNDGWSAFSYDAAGNLSNAKTMDGKHVEMAYDAEGRIATMIDASGGEQHKKTLNFKYNSFNKPIEIAIVGLGAITVTYDDEGEILGVDSEAGHEMALQVTQAFQNLLALIKPSGVTLGL